MKSWKQEYDSLNKAQTSVSDISAQLTDAMDALPVMTERKKKIDMHVQVASKILQEIKKRELNNLQDWEDEIMQNSESIGTQTRTDILRYLKRETTSLEEFQDKLRLLIVLVQCSSEMSLINEAIGTVKEMHSGDGFDPQTEKFLEVMLQQRRDFVQLESGAQNVQ